MKKYFSMLVFTLLLSIQISQIHAQNHWFELNSPTTNFLRALHFADSLTGWVAGDSGLVIFTSDGGENWVEQVTNTNSNIKDIFFLDESRGWAITWNEFIQPIGTSILSTTNGGVNWNVEFYREEYVFMNSIYFLDTLHGWMGGFPGKMLFTTDGGMNWEDANIDSGAFAYFPPMRFNFYNEQYAFVSGGAIDISGVIWRTTNGGDSWKAKGVSPEPVQQLYFIDSLNILGVGGDPEFFGVSVVRTTNGGDDWLHEELGMFGVATSVSFRTKSEGWAPLSFAQNMMYTLDTGATWIEIPTLNNHSIYEIVFTDTLTGYGVGMNGAIIKYKYPITTPYIDEIKSSPFDFNLAQNYPNPFNSSTTINYTIPFSAHVEMTIFDLLGNRITLLEDSYKEIGTYSINWIAENKPGGIYYYQIRAGNWIETKKMILLK